MINVLDILEERNIVVNSINVSPAKPIIITSQLPFSNVTYDFSKMDGDYNYYPATVSIEITAGSNVEKRLYRKILDSAITEITSAESVKIDVDSSSYYKGVYTSCSDIEDRAETVGTTQLQFRCEPFKISNIRFGEELWDTFCFATDVLGTNTYTIKSGDVINLYNPGTYVSPTFRISSLIKLKVNDREFQFSNAVGKYDQCRLKHGDNVIEVVEGSGTLMIDFYPNFL